MLVLEGNPIDGIGAAVLSLAIKTNATLMYIDLAGNRIGVEGTQAVAVAIMLNNTIQKLLQLCRTTPSRMSTWHTIS